MHAVGIDIGGTKIAGALVDESGQILREARVATPDGGGDSIVEAVVALVEELSAGEAVIGVGVAAAGFIDAEQANILYAPNLSWRNYPFKAKLEALLSYRVIIENDANAAGWAEFRYGAGQGTKNMTMLTIGTGVGGAVIADSNMLRGGFGIGGELGHIRVVPDGRLCGCGAHGCIEQYGSGRALLRMANVLPLGIDVLIGAASSGSTLSVLDQVTNAGVMMISPANTSPALTTAPDKGLYWRTAPSDVLQGAFVGSMRTPRISAPPVPTAFSTTFCWTFTVSPVTFTSATRPDTRKRPAPR